MKKVLFATTALVATAGVAAADVSLSGYGRFGAHDNGAFMGTTSRIRLQIDMTTEADEGLTFGARLRSEQNKRPGAAVAAGWGFNSPRFFMRTGGLEVGVGNINGAIEWMPGLYAGGMKSAGMGLNGLGFANVATNTTGAGYWGWDAYSSGGTGATNRQGVEIMYRAGDFSGHVSYSEGLGLEFLGLAASYSMSGWTVALGMQDSNVAAFDKTVLTIGGQLGAANIGLAYADNNGIDKIVLSGSFEVGAGTTIHAFVSDESGVLGGNAYGLGLSHDLGGGASIEAGYTSDDTAINNDQWDLGVRFAF